MTQVHFKLLFCKFLSFTFPKVIYNWSQNFSTVLASLRVGDPLVTTTTTTKGTSTIILFEVNANGQSTNDLPPTLKAVLSLCLGLSPRAILCATSTLIVIVY